MSNKQDLLLLLLDYFRKNCAKAIVKTVCEYLGVKFMFTDIEGHWAEESIKRIVNNELMSGYEDGAFMPDKQLTRAEFAVVIDRILQKQSWYKE